MNLNEFNSGAGTPAVKVWLKPVVFSLEAKHIVGDDLLVGQIDATGVDTAILSLRDTASVPNPPVGEVSFFSTGANFKATDPLGTTVTFLTSGGPSSTGVQSNGAPSVAGNLPKYTDASGLIITDSGVSSAAVPALQLQSAAIADQAEVIAPRGQRDLWQLTSTAGTGGSLSAYAANTGLLYSCGDNVGLSVSNNGGVSYVPATFDVAPTGVLIVGTDGTKVAAVSAQGGGDVQSWISSDGINFFLNPPLPTDSALGFNVDYFAAAGLYITAVNASPTQKLMTSPDGINWSLATASVDTITVASNSTMAVTAGQVAPFLQYSFDGITWLPTPSTVTACRAVGWSEDRKEWLAIAYTTGIVYRSTDGINWVSLGVIAPTLVNTILWVGRYSRWYIARSDTEVNYSLWSTPNPLTQAFVGTHLDGAIRNPLAYSMVYMADRDRFGIGVNDDPFFAYGTIRNDVKALSDNIRVRGHPVRVSNFSSYSDVSLNNSVAEAVISSPTDFLGSLFLQADQPLGARLQFDLNLVATSVAGDVLTIRYYTDNGGGPTLVFSHALTIPALSVNLPVNILSNIVVRNGAIQLNSFELVSNTPAMISQSAIVYDRTKGNEWSITGQWGANVSQMLMNSLVLSSDFINGA